MLTIIINTALEQDNADSVTGTWAAVDEQDGRSLFVGFGVYVC
jgi:hypothetical protein